MTVTLSKILDQILRPLLVLIVSAPIVFVILSLQTEPRVADHETLSSNELARIEQLIVDSVPPQPDNISVQQLQFSEAELNLLLRYSLELLNLSPKWSAELSLADNKLTSEVSVNINQALIPLYFNLRGEFVSGNDSLELEALYWGNLKAPAFLLQLVLSRIQERIESGGAAAQDLGQLLTKVESVKASPQSIELNVEWNPALINSISRHTQQLFISPEDQQRIIAYYEKIAEIATTIPTETRAVSLNTFLVPMFAYAHEKSLAGSDAVAESRTLFQTLAIYINNESIEQLLGPDQAAPLTAPSYIEIRLLRRQDLAQHLVSTAAITSAAGAALAQMLSTTKEAYDARYRTGFSFSDLAANSVGMNLASLSTASRQSALLMQERLATLQNESDYMPQIGSNRDGLSESAFNAMYQDRHSQEYLQRVAEITQLINARPVFEGLTIN